MFKDFLLILILMVLAISLLGDIQQRVEEVVPCVNTIGDVG